MPDLPRRDFYASYLATCLERDVRQILNVTRLRDFERFIRVLAVRSANMLNKSNVARDVGISVESVGDWLSVLQADRNPFRNASYILVRVGPEHFRIALKYRLLSLIFHGIQCA